MKVLVEMLVNMTTHRGFVMKPSAVNLNVGTVIIRLWGLFIRQLGLA